MTTELEEQAALERMLNGPAPYGSGNPALIPRPALDRLPEHSAARQLAEAIGRPALAARVAELCGPSVTAVLAEAVAAAVVRRTRAMETEVAAQLEVAHAAIRARWDVAPDCETPEQPLAVWAARVEVRRG